MKKKYQTKPELKNAARAGRRASSWTYLDCLSGKYPADSPEGTKRILYLKFSSAKYNTSFTIAKTNVQCHFVDADDSISSLSFDSTGEYLATGDTRGFVNIFKRDNSKLSVRKAAMRVKAKFGGDKRASSAFRGGLHSDTWAVCSLALYFDHLFSMDDPNFVRCNNYQNPAKAKAKAPAGFAFYHSFRSHEGEFDYLKSLEIEEKINQITWCKPSTDALLMLTTNGRDTVFYVKIVWVCD